MAIIVDNIVEDESSVIMLIMCILGLTMDIHLSLRYQLL